MHHVVFVHCWSFYTKSIILFDILLVITYIEDLQSISAPSVAHILSVYCLAFLNVDRPSQTTIAVV